MLLHHYHLAMAWDGERHHHWFRHISGAVALAMDKFVKTGEVECMGPLSR